MTGIIEFIIFCGILYYFFNVRANNMVDVLSTRLQEVYAKWGTRTDIDRNDNDNTPRLSLDGLRRAGQQSQRTRIQNREQLRRNRTNSLFKIKESELDVPLPTELASLTRQCCQTCTPTSKSIFIDALSKKNGQLETNIFQIDPGPGLLAKIFPSLTFLMSRKRYDYPRFTELVLTDERVKDAIIQTTAEIKKDENVSEEVAKAEAEAQTRSILSQMESCMNHCRILVVGWLIRKLMPICLKSVIVQNSQIEMIRKAGERRLPLIYVPLHRSHMDYLCFGYILLIINLRNVLIAAGDNLNIPFLGKFMSSAGAFFIKRQTNFIKDNLYRAVLHSYVVEALRAGHHMEFFIEGGRTRTGKPRLPKAGILSMIVDAYKSGIIEDALIVPMSLNYERLLDGNFINEQLGQPKQSESTISAIRALWKVIRRNYGIVKCDICEPFSLHEMIRSMEKQEKHLQAAVTNTLSARVPKSTSTKNISSSVLVTNIARHVVYDSSKSAAIMSTNVLAFLLINKFRGGCTLNELVDAFECLREELEYRKKNVAFYGETLDVINHAIEILGPSLVTCQEVHRTVDENVKQNVVTFISPASTLPNVIELSYYSNSLMVHYVMESLVISALYATLRTQLNDLQSLAENDIKISQADLIEKSMILCDIFEGEFIFCKPCDDLEQTIIKTIDNLMYAEVILLCEEVYLEEEKWSRRYAKTFDNSSDEEYAIQNTRRKTFYKLNLNIGTKSHMEFLHTILRPLIDTYTFSAFTLKKLVDRTLLEKDFIEEIFGEIRTNLDRGIACYGESLSVDSIRNSLKLFEKWGVLDCHVEKNARIYYLKNAYDNDDSASRIYESIEMFKWTGSSMNG